MIYYAKLINLQGEVDYDGQKITCKSTIALQYEDVGKKVIVAYPKYLEESTIIGVVK
jgi:hypothetical protein